SGVHALDLPSQIIGDPGPPEPPVTERHKVLLIVIDGLRRDTADAQPELSALARAGAAADLVSLPPTYSAAQYAALLSGVPPRDSGIRTNAGVREAGLE